MADKTKKKFYKLVSMPIEVSSGDFCLDDSEGRICGYFDNHGGQEGCDLNMGHLIYDQQGKVAKPEKCKALTEI